MIIDGNMYQAKASEQQLYDSLISAPRGDIYDRNMNMLATSSPAWSVFIAPNDIKDLDKESDEEKARQVIADGLSEILDMPRDEIYELTKKNTYYVVVKKRVGKDIVDKIRDFIVSDKDLKLANYVGLEETTKRYYPNDTLASTVLGFVGDDNQGLAGLESY